MRFVVALSVLAAGCGWRSDGLERLEQLYPTPGPVDPDAGQPIDIGTPDCSGYTGTWAVRFVQNGTIAPLTEPWKMTVNDLFLAEGTAQSLELKFCDQDVSIVTSGGQTNLGKAKVPDALKAALAASPISIPIASDGTFHASDLVWLWGLRGLTSPLTDPLPDKDTYVGDPRVYDEDGDGQPGVTLTILAPPGDRSMVRRAVWTFAQGRLTLDNQWLTGDLTSSIDERALAATNPLLLTPAPITPKALGTVYQLRCVGKTYTCAALSADHPRLFKDAPK